MQTLNTLGINPRTVAHLIQSVSNVQQHFNHTDETKFRRDAAGAARDLVTSQRFHTMGLAHPQLKLVFVNSPYTEGILFYTDGDTLFETLLLNMPTYPDEKYFPLSGDDQPVWEMNDPFAERAVPRGYLDYLTWPALRVQLLPDHVNGAVWVYRAQIAPGLKLDNAVVYSPQKLYRLRTTKDGDKWLSLTFSENRALWRDYDTILSVDSREGYRGLQALRWLNELAAYSDYVDKRDRFRLRAVGFLADQAKPILHRDQLLPVSLAQLRTPNFVETLRQARDLAEECRYRLYQAQKKVATSLLTHGGSRQPDSKDVQNLIASWSADSLYWARLEPLFWEWVDESAQEPQTALGDWAARLRRLTAEVFEEVVQLVGDVAGSERGAVEGERELNIGLKKVLGDLL
jgi:CRISPR type I-E-associated protein CasA/Cse1